MRAVNTVFSRACETLTDHHLRCSRPGVVLMRWLKEPAKIIQSDG